MAKKNLVIVESPAKAKTIGKYLGTDYTVKACMGHLRDLPKSVLGVDIENDFTPDYKPIKGKEEIIRDLKKSADAAPVVYLATDPDREGEAISWHLKQLLDLKDEKLRRVTFNEITKKVVNDSIAQPRAIDENLVDAQQARRLLDRIVGYQISPILWRKVRRGLSAGRVQSVATRMVDEREKEINAFTAEEYWTLDASLEKKGAPPFIAHYHGKNGKKHELKTAAEVAEAKETVTKEKFLVKSVKRSDKQRSAAPPFTTSTMQQEASRKLNMTPRRTMAIAQQLYEGVEIAGEGSVGLITYMRTDSLRISLDAQRDAAEYIDKHYGRSYRPEKARQFKTGANAQDAHEAIRPSNVNYQPEALKKDLTREQYLLYRLIWSRFLASQMANAVYDSVSVEITAGDYDFRAGASSIKFEGYTKVYEESRDEEKGEREMPLPTLQEGEELQLKGLADEQHFTQPPSRYTDATLIRAMEEQGIGRPSTYAPIVSTIIDREYVAKDGKYLKITPLGHVVTRLMEDNFSDIVEVKFTANMEKRLDEVEEGKTEWKALLREFYGGFSEKLSHAGEIDVYRVPEEVSEEKCEVCGRNLVVRSGKFGRFLACPGYPECSFTKPITVVMPGNCPKCGSRLLKHTGTGKTSGKQYTYYACEQAKPHAEDAKCDFMSWDVPVKDDCPACGKTMFKRPGKGARKPFCVNPLCERFLPEDKRGYPKKKDEVEPAAEKTAKKAAAKKTTGTKTTAKKTAAKKTAGKTTTAKKTTTKKTTTKKTAKAEE